MEHNGYQYARVNDEMERCFLEHRRLFFADGVDNTSATEAIRKLWYMGLTGPGKPITFIICSPGGSTDAGFAVWDQAKMIGCPITTVVTGLAASMGSILSLCADKGRRFATPNSRILIHQPSIHGVVRGPAADLEIQAKEIIRNRNKIAQLYVDSTGQSIDVIQRAIDRDRWFTPEEAIEFGLLDKVISSYAELD